MLLLEPNREKKIELQTSLGNDIPNAQIEAESPLMLKKQISELKTKFVGATFKSGPSFIYNCHGMTFANRRTGIYEVKNIAKILSDDKFVEVDSSNVMAGDVVLYHSDNGDIEHSGIVLSKTQQGLFDIQILSKWGGGHEVIHSLYICPYELKYIKFYRSML